MKANRIQLHALLACALLLVLPSYKAQETTPTVAQQNPPKSDSQKERSTYLPYPYTGIEHKLDNGLFYEDPDLQLTDIVDAQLRRGPTGELLSNPHFEPAFHKDPDKYYFQLEFPTFDKNEKRIDQIDQYIKTWMNISPGRENVSVSFVKENGKTVLNRVEAAYFNQQTKISKNYIIDVDFIPEAVNFKPDFRRAHKVYTALQTDPRYENNLGIQNAENCSAIRKQLGNPKFFTCNPYVNRMGFHPEDMYSVDVVLKGVMKKFILFHIIPFSEKPAEELHPDDLNMPRPKNETLIDFVLEYIKKHKPRNKLIYKYMMQAVSAKEFVKRMSKFDGMLDDFNDVYKEQESEVDKVVIMKIKSLLWDRKKKQVDAVLSFESNIKMMDDIALAINKYGLKRATGKVKHDNRNLGDLKTYLIRRKRFVTEYHIQKIYEYLDYLRYLKDKKIEQRFFNGFADD